MAIAKGKQSDEERWFYAWCKEALTAGIVTGMAYNREVDLTIDVFDNVEIECTKFKITKLNCVLIKENRFLMNDLKYTYDFMLQFSDDFITKIYINLRNCNVVHFKLLKAQDGVCKIDTKGSFAGKHNDSAKSFPIIQKVLWHTKGIYINKVIPEKFFKETFAPKSFFYTDKGALRYKESDTKGAKKKTYYDQIYRNCEQYLQTLK